MDLKMEIRKLTAGDLFQLFNILEDRNSWIKLMAIIPRSLNLHSFECKVDTNNPSKYRTEHINLIQKAAEIQRRSGCEILFEEWGTSGMIRPRLGHLLNLLKTAELYWAADYIADLSKVPRPERPTTGPAAKVDVSFDSLNSNRTIIQNLNESDYPDSLPFEKVLTDNKIFPVISSGSSFCSNSDNNCIHVQQTKQNVSLPNESFLADHTGQTDKSGNSIKPINIDITNQMSISDMIKFSQTDSNIPDLNYLVQQTKTDHENNIPKLKDSSQTVNTSGEAIPAFSRILKSEKMPAFSQLLDDSKNMSDSDSNVPAFSKILDNASMLTCNIPESTSDDSCNESMSFMIPALDLLQVSNNETIQRDAERKNSLSPVNSSRTTCPSPLPNLSLNTILPHFTYQELDFCTDNFQETMFDRSTFEHGIRGRKLGSGAFGSVYLAVGLLNRPVAVKKLFLNGVEVVNTDDTITKQFRNEVEVLCRYKHENLLSLLGYSCDGPTYCLVYEYVSGGALRDRLTSSDKGIMWLERLHISLGTARAVSYLHNAYSTPLIHRDIKSANILLDQANKPKLCDFGLIKLTPSPNTVTSTTVFGTSAYMAPEAFRGDVSVKLDTFSFGVVLLELLTGLPPFDENREGHDLVTHVDDTYEELQDVGSLLDVKAGNWLQANINFGERLFMVARKCLETMKVNRPFMADIVIQLFQIIDEIN